MRSRRSKKRRFRTLKAIVFVMLLGVMLFMSIQIYINIYAYPDIIKTLDGFDDIEKPEAILVLGAGIKNGIPTPVLEDRLDHAYELYLYYGENISILVSGDNGSVYYNETKAMHDYLIGLGVKEDHIFCDYAGFDTYDSMYRARDVFGLKSFIICTQQYHIYRAVYIGGKLGLDVYGYPAENKEIYPMLYNYGRESLAKVKAIIDTDITKRLPKYLGDPVPVTVFE